MLAWCSRRLERNARPAALAGIVVALVALLYATDHRLGLYHHASTRYRFHAIPVAVSVLYHHRPHDYTAHSGLAMRLQNTSRDLDALVREAVRDPAGGSETYYWVADDRGLADFVIGAFKLFGPRTRSLSKFYFVLLALTLLLFVVGFWHSPRALLVPVLVLTGWLALAQVLPEPTPFANAGGHWAERVALYESRMFDVLGLVAVLHLAVLTTRATAVTPAAVVTAVPQAAFLVLLYHARSSLGWQYLALFSLSGLCAGAWAVRRWRSADVSRGALLPPLFVAALLGASLGGLKAYQHSVYAPNYLVEHGRRTFWHNALMGLAYHPGLRADLPLAYCDDRTAAEFVLGKMAERDPALDRNQWNWAAAMNSLGNHNGFDWNRYEAEARALYLGLWRDRPREMAECHGYYKPRAVVILAGHLATQVVSRTTAGHGYELLAGLTLALVAVGAVAARPGDGPGHRAELRSLAFTVGAVLPFSLIPGLAFYPAITTVACFYLLAGTTAGLLVLRVATRRR